jgi:hypothetical protein
VDSRRAWRRGRGVVAMIGKCVPAQYETVRAADKVNLLRAYQPINLST